MYRVSLNCQRLRVDKIVHGFVQFLRIQRSSLEQEAGHRLRKHVLQVSQLFLQLRGKKIYLFCLDDFIAYQRILRRRMWPYLA